MAIDYRGFGVSTGYPTEEGLLNDGIAAADWALNVAKLPPHRIVLVGQSLGTAIATAVAEHFSTIREIEFAGLVLVAAFTDLPNLVLNYAIRGIIPILSPLRPYPQLQKWLSAHILDTWDTETRLANLVRSSIKLNLLLVHARDDLEISWRNTDKLFHSAANATSPSGMKTADIDSVKNHHDLGAAGWQNTWITEGPKGALKKIKQIIVLHGGNRPL